MRIAVTRKAHFNAAHRLFRSDWSDGRNAEVFGLCANPYYHGHNYELEVRVAGEMDPETGMLIDLKDLADLIRREVEDYLDHRNLNIEVAEFSEPGPDGRTLIASAENIAVVIFQRLRPHIDSRMDLHIRLYETPRNFVDYPA